MRGWILSLVIHAAAVLTTLVAWQSSASSDAPQVNVVPVEIMTLADVSNVSAQSSPQEEEEALPEEATPEPPVEETRPAEQAPQQRRQTQSSLVLADLQPDLLGDLRREKTSPRRNEGAAADGGGDRTGLGTRELAALRDRLASLTRAHLLRNRCWRAPADMPNPERLIVQVRFRLDAQGRVSGRPQVVSPTSVMGDPEMRVAVDRAVAAVLRCDPFPFPDDPIAADHYDIWRDMEFNFDPRQMTG
ncbi:MAG: hypothetical protein AB7O04_12710 [Hyphomonadaceae bacterium]